MTVIRQDRMGWQAVQDALASLAGISLQAHDLNRPLCETSQENPICSMIHALPEGDQICRSQRTRQIQIALDGRETAFFSCPANLHMFAIPVIIPGEDPQFILGGKIYYTHTEFESFQGQGARWGLAAPSLLDALQQTPFGTAESLYEAARLIQAIGKNLIENGSLREKFEERSSQLGTLIRTQSELFASRERSTLFEKLFNILGFLYSVESGAILVTEPYGQTFIAEWAFGRRKELLLNHRFSRSGPLGLLLETGETVSSDVAFEILRMGLPGDIGLVHLFPMRRGQQIQGILLLLDTAIGPEDVRTIEAFTQQISVFLDHLALRENLYQRNRTIELMTDISQVIGVSQNPRELFRAILDKASDFLQAEQGSLMLMEEESNRLSVQAIKGLSKSLVEMLRIQPGEGIAGKVFESGLPILVEDILKDPRVPQGPRSRYRTGSFISAPLKLRDRTIGVINLADKTGTSPFSERDLEVLSVIGAYVTVAIERTAYRQKNEELRKICITDPLTGLLNRRYFQERLIEEVERSRRHRLPVSLMMIDVDDFKGINDTFGHPGGDEFLKTLVLSFRLHIRAIDVAARYGGEEFTIILPQTNKQDASIIAERICKGIERSESLQERVKGQAASTVSIGLATYPDDAATPDELIRRADEALYRAKAQGKNRVILYSPL